MKHLFFNIFISNPDVVMRMYLSTVRNLMFLLPFVSISESQAVSEQNAGQHSFVTHKNFRSLTKALIVKHVLELISY